jgi:ketosteroid isomerase-like protein
MDTQQLEERSHFYIDAFRRQDYDTLRELLHPEVRQVEPGVDIFGAETVIDFVKKMYDSVLSLDFTVTDIFASEKHDKSVVEFVVTVETQESVKTYRGCDHLTWNGEKIELIEAFLYETIVLS